MHPFLQDFRYALRMLRKNPGMTLVIVLSLAIGIGANSAVFSVVDALMLRPLPYPQPDRLAAIWLHSPGIGIFRDWPSPGQYIDMQNENHSFEEMSISRTHQLHADGPRPTLSDRRHAHLVGPVAYARRAAAAGPPAASRRRQAGQAAGGHSQLLRLEAGCSTPIRK